MSHTKTIELLRKGLVSEPNDAELRLHVLELCVADGALGVAREVMAERGALPEEEEYLLRYAEVVRVLGAEGEEEALRVLVDVLGRNKACAEAYMVRARLYLGRGEVAAARKQYGVATVIDEGLECVEFEAKLEGGDREGDVAQGGDVGQVSEQPPRVALPVGQGREDGAGDGGAADGVRMGEGDDGEDEGYVDGDAELDAVLSGSRRWIDFSAIGGMEDLKERIRMSIVYPFQNKELFQKFKKRSGGGLLFYGPPGCGKTLISRATAGECGAHFMSISVHDVLSKWIGESEQRMHALFEEARRRSPTVVFVDEVDALGVKRADAGHTASLVNTFLMEMDGTESDNEDVLVIGATNTPWRVDSAFRRPGRFDHVVFVPPPDGEARVAILQILVEGIPQESLDLGKVAKATEKFSGADLRAVVDRAGEEVLQEMMRSGKEGQLTTKRLLKQVKRMQPTTLEWLEQASNYASYSNQSGLYDDLAEYVRRM